MSLTPRHQLPRMIERGKAQILSLPVHDGGVRVTPIDGTWILFNPSGVEALTSPVSNLGSNDVALSSVQTEDLALGEGWTEEWILAMSVTETVTLRREAALVRRLLYPVVTDADLERVHPGLSAYLPGSQTSWENQRDEAFDQIQSRLLGKGTRPNLITGSWALRNVHLYWSLLLIAELLRVESSGRWGQLVVDWCARAEAEWNAVTFQYDPDDDGTSAEDDAPAVPPLYLCDVPGDWR